MTKRDAGTKLSRLTMYSSARPKESATCESMFVPDNPVFSLSFTLLLTICRILWSINELRARYKSNLSPYPTKLNMQSTASPPPTSAKGRPGPFGLSEHPLLPMAEVGKVNRKGQLRGTATGIFTGVFGCTYDGKVFAV